MRDPRQLEGIIHTSSTSFGIELGSNSDPCERVGEEDRAESDGRRADRDECESVAPRADPSHAHDRQVDRSTARVDGRERDRV